MSETEKNKVKEAVAPPPAPKGRGAVSGSDLAKLDSLLKPFAPDSFGRLRPPLSHEAMLLSLELANVAYQLELEAWMEAGWTDFSIQIDDTLQSGVTSPEGESGERMQRLLNFWKVYRARSAQRERNPIAQVMSAMRQRERSDTIKAVTMIHSAPNGRYVVAIGFMGTGTRFYDWISNLRFTTEEGFHKGFYQLTEYFEQGAERLMFPDTARALGLEKLSLADILSEAKSNDSRFTLWMAGHSQGGAVMQVFCHKLMNDWGVPARNMLGYGFASPTVATGRLPFDPARYPLYHVINSDDLVPRVGALQHLGLGLLYHANDAMRASAYGWSGAPEDVAMREALRPFLLRMNDTPSIMEVCVALCYCLLEEKGEEGLSSLIDKKWTIAPIERALQYAGDKAQNLAESIVRYAKESYHALAGQEMNPETVELLKNNLRPVVKAHTMRELLGGMTALAWAPHRIMREHFTQMGAYSYIVRRGFSTLQPFVWEDGVQGMPQRRFVAPLRIGAEVKARRAVRRDTRAHAKRGVRGKGLSSRRARAAVRKNTKRGNV